MHHPPNPYQTPPPHAPQFGAMPPQNQHQIDTGHLKALAICFYVKGGLSILSCLLGIFYLGLGFFLINVEAQKDPGRGYRRNNSCHFRRLFWTWLFIAGDFADHLWSKDATESVSRFLHRCCVFHFA